MKTIKCALITKKRSEKTYWLVVMFDHMAFLRKMTDYNVLPKDDTIIGSAELIEVEPYKYDLKYTQKRRSKKNDNEYSDEWFKVSTIWHNANDNILSMKDYEEFLSTCEDEIIKVKLQNYINKFKVLNNENTN